ncbi:hypothetical protein V2G26_008931 [Clonostachys chloroleuca]
MSVIRRTYAHHNRAGRLHSAGYVRSGAEVQRPTARLRKPKEKEKGKHKIIPPSRSIALHSRSGLVRLSGPECGR